MEEWGKEWRSRGGNGGVGTNSFSSHYSQPNNGLGHCDQHTSKSSNLCH